MNLRLKNSTEEVDNQHLKPIHCGWFFPPDRKQHPPNPTRFGPRTPIGWPGSITSTSNCKEVFKAPKFPLFFFGTVFFWKNSDDSKGVQFAGSSSWESRCHASPPNPNLKTARGSYSSIVIDDESEVHVSHISPNSWKKNMSLRIFDSVIPNHNKVKTCCHLVSNFRSRKQCIPKISCADLVFTQQRDLACPEPRAKFIMLRNRCEPSAWHS